MPVAERYGFWDGEESLGMFTREELTILGKAHQATKHWRQSAQMAEAPLPAPAVPASSLVEDSARSDGEDGGGGDHSERNGAGRADGASTLFTAVRHRGSHSARVSHRTHSVCTCAPDVRELGAHAVHAPHRGRICIALRVAGARTTGRGAQRASCRDGRALHRALPNDPRR
jgi:hypothetical protein